MALDTAIHRKNQTLIDVFLQAHATIGVSQLYIAVQDDEPEIVQKT